MPKKIIITEEIFLEFLGSFSKQDDLTNHVWSSIKTIPWYATKAKMGNVIFQYKRECNIVIPKQICTWLRNVHITQYRANGIDMDYGGNYKSKSFISNMYFPITMINNKMHFNIEDLFFQNGDIEFFIYIPSNGKFDEGQMITCIGHELGHAYDDLRRVYGSLSKQKDMLEQIAGKYLKMRNGEVRNIRIKNFDKSTNQVTLDYMLNNSQYNPISDLKNDYNKRALSPENDNISKDELWNITYFFQNLYETSPTEMNANISTTNIELKHNKAQSKNNEKKFSKSEIENRVKETKAYKTYSKVLSNSQNIYPKLSDDAINEIREKCKEKNITPYECNFVDNKQWWNCVCQRMQYYAQYCINKCYKNAMLIYYTEDELTKMKQGGNTQLPISNMSKQQIQDRRQQIKNRRGKIQSPFSNNNI